MTIKTESIDVINNEGSLVGRTNQSDLTFLPHIEGPGKTIRYEEHCGNTVDIVGTGKGVYQRRITA